jgi:hypothetical protein
LQKLISVGRQTSIVEAVRLVGDAHFRVTGIDALQNTGIDLTFSIRLIARAPKLMIAAPPYPVNFCRGSSSIFR